MTTKTNAIILLATLAAGAAIGVLLAPDSAEKTGRKLLKKTKAMHGRLQDMLDEGCDLIDTLKGDATELAGDARRTGKHAAGAVRDTVRHVTHSS
ncbi:MAG: YtxH domain-containing protein [Flavobacteriales bacterium]|nr:YtxH domain-containing protein [Flavobacteriales bacterium]